MSFVGLHTHSDYSLLDGASQLPQLVDRAAELGMPALALTDHGVMYGAIELMKVCRGKPVKPIIGNEMYVENSSVKNQRGRYSPHHQVVLAKNTQGYKNLVKLTTKSHLSGMNGKGIFARPCITKELLKEYREGLIVTSGCLAGEVPRMILNNRLEDAKKVAKWYKDVFGEDYYLEIQDHGNWEDRVVNVGILKISQDLKIKIVATNDSHFTFCDDVEAHDALLCIQTGQLVKDEKRMRYSGTEYLKSAEEMKLLFRDHLPKETIEEAIANTLEVAKKVESYNIMGEPRIPNYPDIPPNHNPNTWVQEKAWEGLQERLNAPSRTDIQPVYKERLEYELKMIEKMGFSTYFLVVWDYIKYARDNGIPVGPGRGSAAGSLVAYALRITNIDPVHHGLLFERFLNPERKSMPDIDTDFCIERRDEVIKYVTERYGSDKVAQIITFNRMTSKAVLKDVARVLGISYSDADKMAKLIPVSRGKPEKLKVMISDETPAPEFKQAYDTNTIYTNKDTGIQVSAQQWLDMAIRIEGTNKTFGVHAAGVVISAEPLDEIVPLQKNNDGTVITQYFMEDLESLGLLKMDFLGLKNLTMLQKTVELIKKTRNHSIDPEELPIEARRAQEKFARVKKFPTDVELTYKLLAKGDLEGIFQLESSGMRQIVRDLKPSCIEDISSILALYRPGPLDAGLIPLFINRKHGKEEVKYQHQLLEPILQETYAVLVYQEQIMKVAQDLAGYSLGQADLLRRAMGKKKADEMQKQRETFIDGSTKRGIPARIAENLFDQMVKFAEYCFNKSHSTAYAYVTYQTAYLKANYKEEYMTALLTANSGDQDKVKKYLDDCASLNIKVEPPDINRSEVEFTTIGQHILFGLSAVKNVGENAIAAILKARETEGPFQSLADLCDRVDLRAVNSRTLESLIKCGAFDRLNPNRKQLVEHLDLLIKWAQKSKNNSDSEQLSLFDMATVRTPPPPAPQVADYDAKDKLQYEKEVLGFYVSDHPLKFARQAAEQLDIDPISLRDLPQKSGQVKAIATIASIKQVTTKQNKRMAILQIEDIEGKAEAVVFPETYAEMNGNIPENAPVIISGKVDRKKDPAQLVVDKIEQIPEYLLTGMPWQVSTEGDAEMGEGEPPQEAQIAPPPSLENVEPMEALPPSFEQISLPMWTDESVSVGWEEPSASVPTPHSSIKATAPSESQPLSIPQGQQQPVKNEEKRDSLQDSCASRNWAMMVMVKGAKREIAKNGDWLVRLQIKDMAGSAEAIILPETYERISEVLDIGIPIVLWGKEERYGDRVQLIVEDIKRIEATHWAMVELTLKQVKDREECNRLRAILTEFWDNPEKAIVPVVAVVETRHKRHFYLLSREYWMQDHQSTVERLKNARFTAYERDWASI